MNAAQSTQVRRKDSVISLLGTTPVWNLAQFLIEKTKTQVTSKKMKKTNLQYCARKIYI